MNSNVYNTIKIDFSIEEKVNIEALDVVLEKVSNSPPEMLQSKK